MEKFLVEVSAHHIHLNEEAVNTLFGEGYQLQHKVELSQPGQFACQEKVTVRTEKGEMTMRVLGPTRSKNQIEISLTDTRKLGVPGVVRDSGNVAGTPGCTLVGPKGELKIDEGIIVAKRHVHMTPKDAAAYGVKDGDIVSVKIDTPERSLIFGDTLIRVSNNYALAMHLDTDEANAAGIKGTSQGEIVK